MVLHSGRLHCISLPFAVCVIPFIPADLIKMVIAMIIGPEIRKRLRSCCTVRCTASARIFEIWQNNNSAPLQSPESLFALRRFRASLFLIRLFTRANASHAITFLFYAASQKQSKRPDKSICIFPVQSLYDLSCFCISTFAQIFILLSALSTTVSAVASVFASSAVSFCVFLQFT